MMVSEGRGKLFADVPSNFHKELAEVIQTRGLAVIDEDLPEAFVWGFTDHGVEFWSRVNTQARPVRFMRQLIGE